MKNSRPIRVLVVDDSVLFREVLARELNSDPGIEVVGTAQDPYEARDRILTLKPDVLTLDVEMPKMDGIAFLKKLMPQYPLPVIVVSSSSENVLNSLNAGAVEFVTKPDAGRPGSLPIFINELIVKIKIASVAKVGSFKKDYQSARITSTGGGDLQNVVIAVGASTGGTEALHSIITTLPRDMPGILVVQHMPPVFTRLYAERLNNSCLLEVKEAEDGDVLRPGRVIVAAGELHRR